MYPNMFEIKGKSSHYDAYSISIGKDPFDTFELLYEKSSGFNRFINIMKLDSTSKNYDFTNGRSFDEFKEEYEATYTKFVNEFDELYQEHLKKYNDITTKSPKNIVITEDIAEMLESYILYSYDPKLPAYASYAEEQEKYYKKEVEDWYADCKKIDYYDLNNNEVQKKMEFVTTQIYKDLSNQTTKVSKMIQVHNNAVTIANKMLYSAANQIYSSRFKSEPEK